MAEKTLSQELHTNSFLSALLNVLDPEMAASLAPQLDNQTIPHKFDVIVAGIRQRLKVADVMLNQLEISSHPTITQRVLFAAPSHLDGESSGTACHDDAQLLFFVFVTSKPLKPVWCQIKNELLFIKLKFGRLLRRLLRIILLNLNLLFLFI